LFASRELTVEKRLAMVSDFTRKLRISVRN
jgi:hypothetical protein